MARDPFADPSIKGGSGVFSVGRVAVGLLIIATLTFGFGFYAPLKEAHSSLAKEHQSLNSSHSGTASQLQQVTDQLQSAQKARDDLQAKLKQLDDAEKSDEQKLMSLIDEVSDELSSRVKRKQLSVDKHGDAASILIDDIRLFRGHEATVHAPGRAILCSVAKALKGKEGSVAVSSHATGSKVTNPILRKDFSDTWELTAARASSAVRALSKCGLKPERMTAVGSAHYQQPKGLRKKSTGAVRLLIRQ